MSIRFLHVCQLILPTHLADSLLPAARHFSHTGSARPSASWKARCTWRFDPPLDNPPAAAGDRESERDSCRHVSRTRKNRTKAGLGWTWSWYAESVRTAVDFSRRIRPADSAQALYGRCRRWCRWSALFLRLTAAGPSFP